MESMTRVHTPDEAVCILLRAIALEKSLNLSVLPAVLHLKVNFVSYPAQGNKYIIFEKLLF